MKPNEEKYEVVRCEKEPYFNLDDYEVTNCPYCKYRFMCLEKEQKKLNAKQCFYAILGGISLLTSLATLIECIVSWIINGSTMDAIWSCVLSAGFFTLVSSYFAPKYLEVDKKQEKVKRLLENKEYEYM